MEGDPDLVELSCTDAISIHALRVEGDRKAAAKSKDQYISIHALRVEGDFYISQHQRLGKYISIHALRVEGDVAAIGALIGIYISIHALRVEGDLHFLQLFDYFHISIHALRVEGDSKSSQNIVCFCSTNTKIRRSDITKIHTLCFDQNYFVLFYIIFQLSFGAKVPVLFCPLHVRTRYSSSTSSCDHCG